MTDVTGRTAQAVPWLRTVITGVFALLYAYAVWNAVDTLVQVAQAAGEVGKSLNALGWGLWLFAAVFPIVVFAAALGLSWRWRAGRMLLVLVTGLCIVAVFWLNVQSYAVPNTTALLS